MIFICMQLKGKLNGVGTWQLVPSASGTSVAWHGMACHVTVRRFKILLTQLVGSMLAKYPYYFDHSIVAVLVFKRSWVYSLLSALPVP